MYEVVAADLTGGWSDQIQTDEEYWWVVHNESQVEVEEDNSSVHWREVLHS